MTPRGGRVRPALIGLGLALGFAFGCLAPRSTASAASKSSRVPTIVHKSRSFRIPFNVDPSDRPRLKEVQLWVSEDSGFSWKTVSRTTPDRPAFTFRSSRDGEYWFAVRTLDSKGQVYPAAEEKVEPSMKVIVDTTAPSLVLEPDGRRGSLASVRWEVRDENLDLNSLVIEYQMEGGREWRQVPIRRPALIGSESWEAGTAEPLKVRASVADKAGNVTEATVTLPEGTADFTSPFSTWGRATPRSCGSRAARRCSPMRVGWWPSRGQRRRRSTSATAWSRRCCGLPVSAGSTTSCCRTETLITLAAPSACKIPMARAS